MIGTIVSGIAGGITGCLGGIVAMQAGLRGEWLLMVAGIGLMFSVFIVQGIRLLWFDYRHGMGWFS